MRNFVSHELKKNNTYSITMDSFDLKIKPINTKKSKIYKNAYMNANIIPAHPCRVLFNGRSKSGKSVLVANLLQKEQFYKGYFTYIFLFAGQADDTFEDIKEIVPSQIFEDPDEWGENLRKIFEAQKKFISENGIDKSPRILLIFEDIINYTKFMRTDPSFTKLFIAGRHANISTWITSQSFTRLPRVCRLNCDSIFYFQGSQSERELIVEEFSHPKLNKKQMRNLVSLATDDPYSFLYINNQVPWKERLRKNLDEIIII